MTEITAIKGPNEKFCTDCGLTINSKAEICPKCGVRQISTPVIASSKSRIAAALLALFLGGFGIHKFYLGQTGWGIVYLVFCWTTIPAFVSLVEFVLLLIMSEEKFHSRFG